MAGPFLNPTGVPSECPAPRDSQSHAQGSHGAGEGGDDDITTMAGMRTMVQDAVSRAVRGKEWQHWRNQGLIGYSGSSDTARCSGNGGGGDNHRQVICGWRIRKGPRLLISLRKNRKSLSWSKGSQDLASTFPPLQHKPCLCPPPCSATHPCTLPRVFQLLSLKSSSFPPFIWITCTERLSWARALFHFLILSNF